MNWCRYKFDTPFEREIKQEIFKIVRRGREFGTLGWYFRAISYVSLFFGLQYLWVTQPTTFAMAVIYGISQAFIGLNVQHDANHGAASKKPWVNDLFGLGADFIGGSKWLWIPATFDVCHVIRSTDPPFWKWFLLVLITIITIAPFLHQPQRERSRRLWSGAHAFVQ
jgi:hypothetical protein